MRGIVYKVPEMRRPSQLSGRVLFWHFGCDEADEIADLD